MSPRSMNEKRKSGSKVGETWSIVGEEHRWKGSIVGEEDRLEGERSWGGGGEINIKIKIDDWVFPIVPDRAR